MTLPYAGRYASLQFDGLFRLFSACLWGLLLSMAIMLPVKLAEAQNTRPPIRVDCSSPPVVFPVVPHAVRAQCPECDEQLGLLQDTIESINRVAEELNKEHAALRGLFCSGDPGVRYNTENVCTNKRVELSLIYRGKAEGGFGPLESTVTHLFTLIDQEDYSTADQMIQTIESKLDKPIDITGKCGSCLGILRLTAHGGLTDSLGMRFGPAILSPQEVGPGGVMIDGANRQVLDLMLKLRGYMCNDGLLQIFQCNAATGDKGKELGQAVANYMGINVVAPDFAVPMAYGCGIPDTIGDAKTPTEGKESWHPFVPKNPVDSADALQQIRARALQGRIDSLMVKYKRLQLRLNGDSEAYRECVKARCTPPPAGGGGVTTGGPTTGGGVTPGSGASGGGGVVPPPVPPKPFEPQWTPDNPCPACKSYLELMQKHQRAAGEIDREIAQLRPQIMANQSGQRQERDRIARLSTAIEAIGAGGDGGSAYDPETGITTESWTQPDGRVRVTSRDSGGKLLDEHYRDRTDSAKLRTELSASEAALAELEKRAAQLQANADYAIRARETQLKLAADAQAALLDCIRKNCRTVEEMTSGVVLEQVIGRIGNNPFNPQSPLAGALATPQVAPAPVTPPVPTACTTPQPASETQTLTCPAGQTGTIIQTRSYTCVGTTWTPGAFVTTSNTCTSPAPTGCATNFNSGNYVCSGSCGITLSGLSVFSGSNSMTAGVFGSNTNAGFTCAGALANSQSTNLTILGLPGHRCSLTGVALNSIGVQCQNTSGGTCTSSCSR